MIGEHYLAELCSTVGDDTSAMWLSNMDPGLFQVASTGVSIDEEVTGWLE